jgi:hypothetical protein
MIESPLIEELLAEVRAQEWTARARKNIQRDLSARFSSVPVDIASALVLIQDDAKFDQRIDLAIRCSNLEDFRTHLGLG